MPLDAVRPSLCWQAVAPDTLLIEPLDAFTAVFHRASGITHLLAEPAPEILAVLADEPLTMDELIAGLQRDFDLIDADALAARLDELAVAGLVELVPAPAQ